MLRAASIALVLVAIGAVLIIKFGPNQAIGFMRIEVRNDTNKTVQVQPCWDINCNNHLGLDPTIVPPGKHPIVGGDRYQWENDVWHGISIAVLKPTATAPDFEGCVVDSPPKYAKVWVFRVSRMGACPHVSEGGGLG